MLNDNSNENSNKINTSNYQKKNKFACAAHFFVHFFTIVLHDYKIMPFCTTKTWNFLVKGYFLWRNCCRCSPKIVLLVFLFAFIFFTTVHLSTCWLLTFLIFFRSLWNFQVSLQMKFASFVFSSLALALSLLSTWV